MLSEAEAAGTCGQTVSERGIAVTGQILYRKIEVKK